MLPGPFPRGPAPTAYPWAEIQIVWVVDQYVVGNFDRVT
ncbi:hypothetical protein ES703_84230 [subsurface metagenome]